VSKTVANEAHGHGHSGRNGGGHSDAVYCSPHWNSFESNEPPRTVVMFMMPRHSGGATKVGGKSLLTLPQRYSWLRDSIGVFGAGRRRREAAERFAVHDNGVSSDSAFAALRMTARGKENGGKRRGADWTTAGGHRPPLQKARHKDRITTDDTGRWSPFYGGGRNIGL